MDLAFMKIAVNFAEDSKTQRFLNYAEGYRTGISRHLYGCFMHFCWNCFIFISNNTTLKPVFMKKIVTTLFCGVLSLSAFAQLQLNYNNAAGNHPGSVVIKTDMVNRVNIQGGGLPNFDPANNMHWDMSAVAYNTPVDYIGYDTNTSVVFIPSNYTGTVLYNLTPLIPYVTHPKFEIRTTDMRTYGEHLDRQPFPIGFVTGTPTDSLVILNQDVLYSPFVINFPYPTAPNISNWQNSTTTVTNMELTYSSQSYNQTPIYRVTHATRIDSAVGWGTISAIRLDNQPGGEVDVIQIKNIIITQDSFYQSGGPIPSNILSIFGVTQGQTNTVYQYQWMRAGEMSNMMTVTYDDYPAPRTPAVCCKREQCEEQQ
jgi:hypothetical protein